MKTRVLVVVGFILSAVGLSAQVKPVIVVQALTAASGVEVPYDLKLLNTQLLAELKVLLGREFDVVADTSSSASGAMYTLDGDITGWRAGNTAKRLLVGLGSGREATDIQYRVTDASGKRVLERKDTVRTNYFSQTGSTGTLTHPIAQKIAERIKDARLQ